MSIFLAFSLQKRLEHILNSMPGYSPPSAPKDPLARLHIVARPAVGTCCSCLACPDRQVPVLGGSCEVGSGSTLLHGWGLHHQIQALPFPSVNALVLLPAFSGVPSWRMEGLFASHPPSSERVSSFPPYGATRGAWLCQPEWAQPFHSHDPAQQGPRQGPQDPTHQIAECRHWQPNKEHSEAIDCGCQRGPYMISPLISCSHGEKQAAPE